jgi:hypothetical protein
MAHSLGLPLWKLPNTARSIASSSADTPARLERGASKIWASSVEQNAGDE